MFDIYQMEDVLQNKMRYLNMLLDTLHIDPLGSPQSVLPALKNLVNTVHNDQYYFYLWTGDGETVAHGKYPQLIGQGPVILYEVAEKAAALVPDISAQDLRQAALAVVGQSISVPRAIRYRWSDGTIKTAYVIRLLIGDQVYVLGI